MTRIKPTAPLHLGKYFPPQILPATVLQRTRLLKSILSTPTPCQFYFLEAQAGQGKTTVALQLMEQLALPAVWYQMGPEDRDPVLFLLSLLQGIQKSLDNFSSPIPLEQLENGQVELVNLPHLVQTICEDLDAYFGPGESADCQKALLILDDVQFIEGSKFSIGLLDAFLDTIPDTLLVILLSRSPIPLRSKRVRFGGKTLFLGNQELAMTRDEGVDLIALLLGDLPEPTVLNNLLHQSGGWPMGIVLASQNHMIGAEGQQWREDTVSSYLEREFLTTLEPSQYYTVLKLALLDKIPQELAQQVAPDEDVSALLHLLVKCNFFLRILNDKSTLFGFHHLVLSFLQHKAKLRLTKEEQVQVYSLAANYYFELDRPGKGMEHQLHALDFRELEKSMEQFGQTLLAKGRHVTLNALLMAIPEEIIQQSAWFSYCLGLTLQVHDPLNALQAFQRARTLFHKNGHDKGELLTTSNILYLYIIHSTILPRSEAIHPDIAHTLFKRVGTELPPFCRITTTHNIALGYLYFLNDFGKTRHYNNLTRELASQSKLPNMLIASKLASGWADNMSGQLDKAIAVVEQNYNLINRKELGFHNLMQLYLFQLDITRTIGGSDDFFEQRDEFIKRVGEEAIHNSFVGPWITLWELELSCECGDYKRMQKILENSLDSPQFQISGNFRGELHAWFALYLSITGEEIKRIESLLLESEKCIDGLTSPKLFIRFALLSGQVLHHLGRSSEALQRFKQAKSAARKCGMDHMLAWLLLLEALVHHSSDNQALCEQSLQDGFDILVQKQRYSLMTGFFPEVALRICRLAFTGGIHPDFCQKYAWNNLKTAFVDKHDIPLLSIQILGGFSFTLANHQTWDMSTVLSPIQRKFFGLLLIPEAMSVSQKQIQTELWPDITEQKARQRFDTMMTRLRKTLAPFVSPYNIEKYLLVGKGVVSLKHCLVDAREFCTLADLGIQEMDRDKWWQAGNSFTRALKLWKGAPAIELLELNHDEISDRPALCLSNMAKTWCPALLQLQRHKQAQTICQIAWKEDQASQRLTRMLYEILVSQGAIREGRQVIDSFAKASREIGIDEDAIDELVTQIIHS